MKINEFTADLHFSSAVYRASYPGFLPVLRPLVNEYFEHAFKTFPRDDIYPAVMTDTFHTDVRFNDFRDSVLQVAWDILNSQGYFMDPYFTTCTSMWAQSHPKTSSMDMHIHGDGNQINAFYILDAPDNSCTFTIHDPRSSKNILSLPIRQSDELSLAHNMVNYIPKEGDIILTNSWLPHSFTRNRSNDDFNFIHVNINVIPNPEYQPQVCEAPIIV